MNKGSARLLVEKAGVIPKVAKNERYSCPVTGAHFKFLDAVFQINKAIMDRHDSESWQVAWGQEEVIFPEVAALAPIQQMKEGVSTLSTLPQAEPVKPDRIRVRSLGPRNPDMDVRVTKFR